MKYPKKIMGRARNLALCSTLILCVICSGPLMAATISVISGGGGDYTSIQAAINFASQFDVIEVQDSATYAENLVFVDTVTDLTLRAGAGQSPTIQLSGLPVSEMNIEIAAANTTIEGFTITFTGTTDPLNKMIQATASGVLVKDCVVIGDGSVVDGIVNVDDLENVEVSGCRIGIYFEGDGLNYDAISCHSHDCAVSSLFVGADCNVFVDDCLLENSAQNVITNGADHNLLIQNSIMRNATVRNFDLKGPNTAGCVTTVNNSMILGGAADCILQYGGTLNLNYTIIAPVNQAGVAMYGDGSVPEPGICNIDHCTIAGASNQWAAYTLIHADNQMTVTNSIINGPFGGLYNGAGTLTSDYNNIFSTQPYGFVTPGANDFLSDPLFVQTTDPDSIDFYRVSSFAAAAFGDDSGGSCGAAGFLPAGDLNLTLSVDLFDLAELGVNWQGDFITVPGTDTTEEDFESYTDNASLSGSWEASSIDGTPGADPNLLIDPLLAYEGSKAVIWDYDTTVATAPDQINSEILFFPDSPIDLSLYDEVSLWVYREPGNVKQQDMYIWLYNWGSDSALWREAYTIAGNTDEPAGVWAEWRFNLHDNVGFMPGIILADLTNIEAIGIGTRTEIGTLGGTGTILLDKIQLHTLPECAAGFPVGDIDQNCLVDMSDLILMAGSWLQITN